MQKGFWGKLKKPIMALAPMANVTDAAFRPLIAHYGKPDVMWTEFVSCDGLVSAGREALLVDLRFTEAEHPIVAQFFGAKPENFYECALLAQELGFDGIDINMGCPDKNVEKQGAGAALIKNPALAQKIIAETKRGAGPLPVSVKTRIGYNKNTLDEWLPALLETELAAITLHLRTRKEMSSVPAHWDVAGDAVSLRNKLDSKRETLILGNGDAETLEDAKEKASAYGLDGVMIGRGIFGNPWLFDPTKKSVSVHERLEVMLEHTLLFEKTFAGKSGERPLKNFDVMKKHYKAYVSGFDGAKELRVKLMETKNAAQVKEIVNRYLTNSTVVQLH